MFRNIIHIIIALLAVQTISASNLYFTNINCDMGLSQNNVKSIYQDSYGFLWFGTKNKLNRYDGKSLKYFDCFDHKLNRGNNNVSAIGESSKRKLWVGTDKGVYVFDPIYESFSFFDVKTADGTIIEDWISAIERDSDGSIWVVAPNQGVFNYCEESGELKFYQVVKSFHPSVSNPQCMTIEEDGTVWIGTNGSGLFRYDKESDSFTQYLKNSDSSISLLNKNIYTITHYKKWIIVGIHEEKLLFFDKNSGQYSDFDINEVNYKIIRDLQIVNDKQLWAGTQFGLFVIDLESMAVSHSKEDFTNPYSISDNTIEKTYQDREGNIWIGTGSNGVDFLPKSSLEFKIYLPTSNPKSLKSKRVRRIIEDKKGRIWVGTEDAGLFVYDQASGEFHEVKNIHYSRILSLLTLKDEICVGYFKNGLDVIQREGKGYQVTHYSPEEMGLNEESVYALCEDSRGNVWLGNAWGVYLSESNSRKFVRQGQFGLCYTHDIVEDSRGNIWLATIGSGVFCYNPNNNETTHFVAGSKENSLSSNSISSITEDHKGQIWFSTDRGGVCVYNPEKDEFKRYSIEEGLPDDVAYKIVEDREHKLWFGTNRGLVRLDPVSDSVTTFTTDNRLPSNQFNYTAGMISSSGEIFLGTSNGMISFNPNNIVSNKYIAPLYITKLSLFNNQVEIGGADSLLSRSLQHTKTVTLPHDKTNITLDFTALSYSAPQNNRYLYMMEGVDNEWLAASESQSATYSNLSPGSYLFKVKGANCDGVWNPEVTTLQIVVTPPWWRSNLALVLYLLLLLLIIYGGVREITNRFNRRQEAKQRAYNLQKERELYEDKINFFTNIAHEIRTPLSLISAPLEALMEIEQEQSQSSEDKAKKKYLNVIERNTQNLLTLINQLLDFRKVGEDKLNIDWGDVELVGLLYKITYLFDLQIKRSGKKLNISVPKDEKGIYVLGDKGELSKVLNNLISNAVKYSDSQINIVISADDTNAVLSITNDGKLIPEDYRKEIFSPFFQVKDDQKEIVGSGIGLPLAQSLANLHNGTIKYNSDNGCNNFILTLPIHEQEEDFVPIVKGTDYSPAKRQESENQANITVLVVDDNLDITLFLANKLKERYNILTAFDGVDALELLSENKVDIVVSDIMMPRMDGFELCAKIKESPELNHIIVLLLTAKSDLQSKIKGLEVGADGYVEKPFSIKYLFALLSSLVASKMRDTTTFIKRPIAFSKQVGMDKEEELFVDEINDTIQKNIDNSDFNVGRLAELMNMSRSGLHRKMTEIIDTPPVEYIRLCRLQRAADLISEGKYRVNEIAYMVGFNTPSYFIKLFQSHYGMTPKEFEEHIKDQVN